MVLGRIFLVELFWLIGGLSFGLVLAGLFPFRRFLVRRRIMDIPNGRSSHSLPTPRGGGMIIVALSLVGFLGCWLLYPDWPLSVLLILLSGAALIALEGWLDDLYSFPARQRFLCQAVIVNLVVWGLISSSPGFSSFPGGLYLGKIVPLAVIFWVMGLINAYNFMDGIDGLAGIQAVSAGFGWAVLGWLDGQMLVSLMGLIIASASLGFLGHNWSPARIFMGDVGSAFLGYIFAMMAVISFQKNPRLLFAGILLVWPFIFDASFTFLRRLMNRENVFSAHRTHLYQRLIISGYSHRSVAWLYLGLDLAGFVLAIFWVLNFDGAALTVLFSCFLLGLGLWILVLRQEEKRLFRNKTMNIRVPQRN